MEQSRRDQETESIVRSAVVRLFGEDPIDHIDVFPTQDSDGEAGLSVTVFLKSPDTTVSGVRLGDTIVAVSDALRAADDDRFPYVTFLAPGYDHAEDDVRRAE